jgi:hypothetical protein
MIETESYYLKSILSMNIDLLYGKRILFNENGKDISELKLNDYNCVKSR